MQRIIKSDGTHEDVPLTEYVPISIGSEPRESTNRTLNSTQTIFKSTYDRITYEGGLNINLFGKRFNIGGKKVVTKIPCTMIGTTYEWGFKMDPKPKP